MKMESTSLLICTDLLCSSSELSGQQNPIFWASDPKKASKNMKIKKLFQVNSERASEGSKNLGNM